MALTEENWSTISIDPYENYTGEKPFLVDEGDYYRGDRPVHLGHVYKRFRGRVKPQLVDPGSLTMLLEELALAEGNFVTERPAWLDAKSDGPMADALRPLRAASPDEDGEDR